MVTVVFLNMSAMPMTRFVVIDNSDAGKVSEGDDDYGGNKVVDRC